MLSNYLTNEIKGCLKKIDDLDFHFEKYKEHETKCKELKKTLDALERRCERYKRYCEEMESHSQGDIEAFYQDFRNLNCKVSEFTCDYENLKQVTEKLDFKNFAFLIDTEKTKEIADQCWEAGYAIIESDEKLQLKFIVEENKLKQEVDINQEECRKDKQLIAEKILQELGKIKEGPKNKQIREDLELVGKLTNSSQLLKAAKEKYCTLEEIFNQSNEVFNSMQERVYQLNENFFALSDEIKKTRSSDGIMEPIVQDPEKTREILEKILTEKEKRKEKGLLDVARELVKKDKTYIEKQHKKLSGIIRSSCPQLKGIQSKKPSKLIKNGDVVFSDQRVQLDFDDNLKTIKDLKTKKAQITKDFMIFEKKYDEIITKQKAFCESFLRDLIKAHEELKHISSMLSEGEQGMKKAKELINEIEYNMQHFDSCYTRKFEKNKQAVQEIINHYKKQNEMLNKLIEGNNEIMKLSQNRHKDSLKQLRDIENIKASSATQANKLIGQVESAIQEKQKLINEIKASVITIGLIDCHQQSRQRLRGKLEDRKKNNSQETIPDSQCSEVSIQAAQSAVQR